MRVVPPSHPRVNQPNCIEMASVLVNRRRRKTVVQTQIVHAPFDATHWSGDSARKNVRVKLRNVPNASSSSSVHAVCTRSSLFIQSVARDIAGQAWLNYSALTYMQIRLDIEQMGCATLHLVEISAQTLPAFENFFVERVGGLNVWNCFAVCC